jgi:hypothetical protein
MPSAKESIVGSSVFVTFARRVEMEEREVSVVSMSGMRARCDSDRRDGFMDVGDDFVGFGVGGVWREAHAFCSALRL